MHRSSPGTVPRLGSSMEAMPAGAIGKRLRPSKAHDWALPERTGPLVAVGSPGLTQHEPAQQANQTARRSGKAQSALPSFMSCAAGAHRGKSGQAKRCLEVVIGAPGLKNPRWSNRHAGIEENSCPAIPTV